MRYNLAEVSNKKLKEGINLKGCKDFHYHVHLSVERGGKLSSLLLGIFFFYFYFFCVCLSSSKCSFRQILQQPLLRRNVVVLEDVQLVLYVVGLVA